MNLTWYILYKHRFGKCILVTQCDMCVRADVGCVCVGVWVGGWVGMRVCVYVCGWVCGWVWVYVRMWSETKGVNLT